VFCQEAVIDERLKYYVIITSSAAVNYQPYKLLKCTVATSDTFAAIFMQIDALF